MVGTMGVRPRRLEHDTFMEELTNFYNYMTAKSIDPTTLDAETLWELKDISDINARYVFLLISWILQFLCGILEPHITNILIMYQTCRAHTTHAVPPMT